jgi:hypothetical protein
MTERRSPKEISSLPRHQGLGESLLDALHGSRRRQAAREIDNYRHLLDKAKVDEAQRVMEELKRESIPIWSLWQPQFTWMMLMMKRTRAWMQAARLFASQGPNCT